MMGLPSEERQNHPLWRLPVFQSHQFLEFKEQMQVHLAAAQDPSQATLHQVIPHVSHQISNVQRSVNMLSSMTETGFRRMDHFQASFAQQAAAMQSAASTYLQQVGTTNLTAPAAQANLQPQLDNNLERDADRNEKYSLPHHFASVSAMYNEWYQKGGIHENECQYGTEWRQHFEQRDKQKLCQIRKVVSAVDNKKKQTEDLSSILKRFDELYQQENYTLTRLEK